MRNPPASKTMRQRDLNNQGKKSTKVEDQTGGVSSIQQKLHKDRKGKTEKERSHEINQKNFSQQGGVRAQLVPSTVDESRPAPWHSVMVFQNTEKILQAVTENWR